MLARKTLEAELISISEREHRRVGHDLVVSLEAGESVTVEKVAAIFTGRDHAISEPGDAAARLLSRLGRYGEIRDGHLREWAHLWERFDITFDGSPDALRVVRLHLLQFSFASAEFLRQVLVARVEAAHVASHCGDAGFLLHRHDALRVRQAVAHRTFDQHMLAGAHGDLGLIGVDLRRAGDELEDRIEGISEGVAA
jgi:hypothetical protein